MILQLPKVNTPIGIPLAFTLCTCEELTDITRLVARQQNRERTERVDGKIYYRKGPTVQKRLLVTVSEDINGLDGIRFIGSFFKNKAAVSATIFYAAPLAHIAGTGFSYPVLDRKAIESAHKLARKSLDTAMQMLCDSGFPAENVTTKLIFREFGTAKEIIKEAREGAYDGVVLGKRGHMLFRPAFSTSVTKEILDQSIDFPIWICRHPEEGRKNVLLCVDGSSASLRMIDHVGFMLRDEDEHAVTIFHLDTGEEEDQETILGEARRRLLENWISDGRVTSIVAPVSITGVAQAILQEAEKNSYAVVGVGRVGVQKGRVKEWLLGSRTMKMVEAIEKATLWISS